MKRVFLFFTLILFFTQTSYSMKPGPPLLAKCPECGHEKSLLSLISGNTIGAVQWSDGYSYAPMLPRVSRIQKCPECGAYFFMRDIETRHADEEMNFQYSFDTGRLTFPEIKEALLLLEDSGLNRNNELVLRMEFLFRYNDAFRNYSTDRYSRNPFEGDQERSETDVKLHKENIKRLISLIYSEDDNKILVAELYREAGMFGECLIALENCSADNDFIKELTNRIREKALASDSTVFQL